MFEVQKSKTQVIRAELSNYKERDFVNLRVWFENRDGEYCPGKQGLTIPPNKLGDVIKILQAIEASDEFAKVI